MTVNKDLYERYLAKKAKKLGVSVESLRGGQSTSAQSAEVQQSETVVQSPSNGTGVQSEQTSNYSSSIVSQQSVYDVPSSYTQQNIYNESSQQFSSQSTYEQPVQQTYSQPVPPVYQNSVQQSYEQQFQRAYEQPARQQVYNAQIQPQLAQPTYNNYSNSQHVYSQSVQPVNVVEEQTIVDKRENKFAVIGFPLGHSLSSVIHTVGFKSMGLEATYETLETDPEDLVSRIKMLKNGNYKGFNVTIPLKLPVALFVDEVDKSADIASAINTVVINPDRTMKGYNTDVIGFKRAIPSDFKLYGKVAGILGTGGASRAATVALAQAGVKEIRYYTRNIPNCLDLLNYMRRVFPHVQFDAFQIEFIRDLSMVDILVNTTPIGMLGRSADMTPVEKPQLMTLPQGALVYDVIYNPRKTVLLKLAESLGYRTVNGLDMFLGQAIAAEEIWTGKTPNSDSMKIALLESL